MTLVSVRLNDLMFIHASSKGDDTEINYLAAEEPDRLAQLEAVFARVEGIIYPILEESVKTGVVIDDRQLVQADFDDVQWLMERFEVQLDDGELGLEEDDPQLAEFEQLIERLRGQLYAARPQHDEGSLGV